MSIQAECREAMARLAARGATFTEIDVANEAAQDGWSSNNLTRAMKDAYSVLQGEYKKGKLVRFGPVEFQGIKDYARRGAKIVYADAEKGPATFDTPNGQFPRLLAKADSLNQVGRRRGTSRDDTKPWGAQDVSTTKRAEPKGPAIDPAPLLRRIEELQAEVRRLKADRPANGNGNGNHRVEQQPVFALDMDALVELLADRVASSVESKVIESVRTSVAEALIS